MSLVPPPPQPRSTADIPPPPSEIATSLGIGHSSTAPRARVLTRTATGFHSERATTWEDKKKRIEELSSSGWGCPRIRAEDVEQNRRDIAHRAYRPLGQFVPWEDVMYGKYVTMGVPFGSQNHYKDVLERKQAAQVHEGPQLEANQGDQEYSAVHYKREPAPPPSSGYQTLRRRIRESESRLKSLQAGGHFYDHVPEPHIPAPPVSPTPDDDDTVDERLPVPPLKLPPAAIELEQGGSQTDRPRQPKADEEAPTGSQTARPARRRRGEGATIGGNTRYTRFIADRTLDPVWQLEQTRSTFHSRKSQLDQELESELQEQELSRRENYRQKFRAFHLALGEPTEEEEEEAIGSQVVLVAAAETLGKLMARAQRAVISAPPQLLSSAAAIANGSPTTPPAPTPMPLALPLNVERRPSGPGSDSFANLSVSTLEEMIREMRAAAESLTKVAESKSEDLKNIAVEALATYKAAGQRRRGSVFSANLLEKSVESSGYFLETDRVLNHLNLAATAPDERTRVVAIEQLGHARMDIRNVPKSMCVMREILEGKAGQWHVESGQTFSKTPRVSWRGHAHRDLKAMRLEARRAQLQKLITKHRHHPWYIDLLAEVTKGGREITNGEQLIINQAKRLVELGQNFDRRMFYAIAKSVRPADMRNPEVQAVLSFLRERAAQIPFPEYARWLVAHGLPVPQPVSRRSGRDSATGSPIPEKRAASGFSTAMHVEQARRRLRNDSRSDNRPM